MGKQLGEGAAFANPGVRLRRGSSCCAWPPRAGAEATRRPGGRRTRVTPFEARASVVARSLAGPDVSIECAAPADRRLLQAEYGFDRELTWALTRSERTRTAEGLRRKLWER